VPFWKNLVYGAVTTIENMSFAAYVLDATIELFTTTLNVVLPDANKKL
jgi:hypothetical protein